ncbi:hypothetical protein F2Q70_00042518 [Brassica cretica]|uniref:Uncharacterized protein n=1 Tax=Brassica cretica TaxID=69181 RepID=A0A8S9KGR7_BRACR|nr:hypothetical protein F2Q70_00042518 [Brassica cretica]
MFLGVVDCNQLLYDGPALKRAIYRYNAYWLPLLAKHSESSSICEGPLVPPFDYGKSNARCFAMASGKNSARCFAVGAEKNGGCGCGNLMENNAQENAPLAEGATAA